MKILQYLIEDNKISIDQAVKALATQITVKEKVGKILLRKKEIDTLTLVNSLSKQSRDRLKEVINKCKE